MALARQNGALGDYYETRLQVIDEAHEISRRIARMRLLGRASWSREDYQLAFALKHGYIKLPKGSLYDPAAYNTEPDNASAIRRGLFNVKRWVGDLRDSSRLRVDNDPFPELPGGAIGTGVGALGGVNPIEGPDGMTSANWAGPKFNTDVRDMASVGKGPGA